MRDTNVSREDMISCTQEWFAQGYTLNATLYYDLRSEIENQLEFILDEVARERAHDGFYKEASDA